MTYKEKLEQEHPEMLSKNYDGGCKDCPHDYGYCENPPIEFCRRTTCEECWNREMPNTESKDEADCDDVKAAYEQGLSDAWEMARKIIGILDKDNHSFDASKLRAIYGTSDILEIFKLTYQEALAELKAYEDSRIEVGDVVVWTDFADDTFNGVVLDFKDNTDDEVVVFTENSCVDVWKIAECKKTGKHIDIQSLLEQIGGE